MNYRMIFSVLGIVLLLLGGFLLLPCVVALIYGEGDFLSLLITAAVSGAVGALLALLRPKEGRQLMHAREGFIMVALSWIMISLVGALPFYLNGAIPSYLDAVFETVSGFTTTGASILSNVEAIPHGLLLWRSFTHWIGGMGVLVFMLAVVPMSGESIYLLRAESPGPSVSKMVPKMRTSAAITYGIYIAMTLLLILMYQVGRLFGWGNISLYDSVCLAFGTAGTGGFAVRCDGLASYSMYEQALTTVFMILFGINFSIYFFLLCRKYKLAWQNSELKCYIGIVLTAITLITVNLVTTGGYFDKVGDAVHHVAFSVGSVITTTGYGTVDFAQWPEFSRVILVLLMIIGACAGSTGGGMKVSRVLILFKNQAREIRRMIHPHAVETLTMDKKKVEKSAISGTSAFLSVYFVIMLISIALLSLDNFGTETTVTAVMATLNNIGPGTSAVVGPFGGYGGFSPLSKLVIIFDMLCGRLELFPMLLLLRPSTWRKH